MKESEILKSITEYLDILQNMGKLRYIRNNTGAVVSEYKGKTRFIRYGSAGSPDLLVFYKGYFSFKDDIYKYDYPATLHIECKTEKGKQNDSQIQYQKDIEKLGHKYIIARSLDDITEVLN